MTANLKALVQKWRELFWRNQQPWPDISADEYARGKQAGECADELAREIERMESEPRAHESYVVPADLMRRLWSTIDFYSNQDSYRGERTGGVLQGCPRAPNPTPEQMTFEARMLMRELTEWRDKNYPVKEPSP